MDVLREFQVFGYRMVWSQGSKKRKGEENVFFQAVHTRGK